jgi:hypothetical protein
LLAAVKMAEVSFYSTLARAARDKDTCDVTYRMELGPIPIDGIIKGLLGWNADIVLDHIVEGITAPDPDRGARRLDEGFSFRDRMNGIRGKSVGLGEPLGKPLALVDIEDREALQEGQLSGRFAPLAALVRALILGGEVISITDRRALFALADMAAQRFGLSVGQPAL